MTRRPGMIATAVCATAAIGLATSPTAAATSPQLSGATSARAATSALNTSLHAPTSTGAIQRASASHDWPSFWDHFPDFWDWWFDFIGDKPGNPFDPTPTPTPTATPTPSPTNDKPKPTPTSTPTATPTPSPTTDKPKPTPTSTPTATPTPSPTTDKPKPTPTTPTASPTPTPTPTQPGGSNRDQQRVLELVNQERTKRGLKPLTMDTCLRDRAAQEWSEHMARKRRMYHQPMRQVTRKCPDSRYVGENVAMGYTSPEAVMRGWMSSSGHRSNILRSSYTKIGIGVAKSSNGRLYWTQVFSR